MKYYYLALKSVINVGIWEQEEYWQNILTWEDVLEFSDEFALQGIGEYIFFKYWFILKHER